MRALKLIQRHWGLTTLALLFIGGTLVYRLTGLHQTYGPSHIGVAREHILNMGWRGIAVYMAIYVMLVTFGIPNFPLQIAAGAIWGTWRAYAMMLFGVNLGALGAFTLARKLGRRSVEDIFGHWIAKLNHRIEKGGFRIVLILRLIPFVPFNAINYAAGVSRIQLRDYLAANAVGMMPMTFIHVLLGAAAGSLDLADPHSWLNVRLWLPMTVSLGMIGFAFLLGRRNA